MRSSFSNALQKIWQKFPELVKKHYWQYRTVKVPLISYLRHPKEVELLSLLPNRPKIIIDIGANRGEWSNAYIELLSNTSAIYMFEPIPKLFQLLQKRFQESSNVHTFNTAISNKKGVSRFNISESDDFSSFEQPDNTLYQVPKTKTILEVDTDTLDNIHHNVLRDSIIDLLKIDTQGHESAILSQANKALKFTKALIIEWNIINLYQSNSDFINIHQCLSEQNFVLGAIVSQSRWGHRLSYADALYFNKQFLDNPHFIPSIEI